MKKAPLKKVNRKQRPASLLRGIKVAAYYDGESNTCVYAFKNIITEEILEWKSFEGGDADIAAFFGIIRALKFCKLNNFRIPIVTMSKEAFSWVKTKKDIRQEGGLQEQFDSGLGWLKTTGMGNNLIFKDRDFGESGPFTPAERIQNPLAK